MNRRGSPGFLAWLASLLLAIPGPAQQSSVPVGEWRQWTLDGKTKVEAAMRGVDSGNVILQSRDGRAATMPLARIGGGDRAYVRAAIGGLVLEAVEKANAGPAVSASLGAAAAPAARSGWQGGVRAEPASCEVAEMPQSGGRWQQAFRSRHFEFCSTAKLPLDRQRDVARLFEVQYELHRRAGWGVGPALEGGARLKIELYDTEDAYAASGALPATGCDLDRETGILRCTLEAAGLHAAEGEWFMDSVLTPKAVARGVTLMVLSDAIELLPLWVLNGMATCMGAIPVTGGTAWPDRAAAGLQPLVKMAKSVGLLEFTEKLKPPPPPAPKPQFGNGFVKTISIPVHTVRVNAAGVAEDKPPPEAATVEHASSAMLAYYFMFIGAEPGAAELGAMIGAARRDQRKWAEYDEAAAKYQEAWAKIKARTDVVDKGGGRYLIPSGVEVPATPEPPHEVDSRDELRQWHVWKLTHGAAPEKVSETVKQVLRNAGFDKP